MGGGDLSVVAAALVSETVITLGDLASHTLGSSSDVTHGDSVASSADRPSSRAGTDDSTLRTSAGSGGWGGEAWDTDGSKTDERSASSRCRGLARSSGDWWGAASGAGSGCGVVTSDGGGSSSNDLRTRVLVLDGNNILGDGTAVVGVRTEQVGESVETSLGGLGATDGDGSALHVHLSVSETVEPSPCNDSLSSGKICRNLEAEKWQHVRSIGIKIALSLDRVVSLPRGHDSPPGALGWLGIISDRHLTRPTTVNSRSNELERLGASRLVSSN